MKKAKLMYPVWMICIRLLKSNKQKNIIAISAIILTTVLFAAVFTMGLDTIANLQAANIRQVGSSAHATIYAQNSQDYDVIRASKMIKRVGYSQLLSAGILNEELKGKNTEFWYFDTEAQKFRFIDIVVGKSPEKDDEIAADTDTLRLLNVPLEIGAPVTLEMVIGENIVHRTFKVSGWWSNVTSANVGTIIASKAYVHAYSEELNSVTSDDLYTGLITLSVAFQNSVNLQKKIEQLYKESNFSIDEGNKNYRAVDINWAYMSAGSINLSAMLPAIVALLLVFSTGYLIIYNIFNIFVVRDIRLFGLFKTLGMTKKQIKRLIIYQASILSLIAIPIGFIIGYLVGGILIPFIMKQTYHSDISLQTITYIPIFGGTALFSFGTVLFSTSKACRIATQASAIEASRYSDIDVKHRYVSKRKKNFLFCFAKSNLHRNTKRACIAMISSAIGIVLFCSAMTLHNSFSMEKYISKFVSSDFLVAHHGFFQQRFHLEPSSMAVPEQMINSIKSHTDFATGGRIFFNGYVDRIKTNNISVMLYGADPYVINNMTVIDRVKVDSDIKYNNYPHIWEGVHLDDFENPDMYAARFAAGDIVEIEVWNEQKDSSIKQKYVVIGHVGISSAMSSRVMIQNTCTLYMPTDEYKRIIEKPIIMSFLFDVREGRQSFFEMFLSNQIDAAFSFESEQLFVKNFKSMIDTVLLLATALCLIVGLIGIINFINTITMSILTRRRELAILQSIGMTEKQTKRLLCYEGVFYFYGSSLLAVIFSTLVSLFVVRPICNSLWFTEYRLVIWPLCATIPILFVIGFFIPILIATYIGNESVIERLRRTENLV